MGTQESQQLGVTLARLLGPEYISNRQGPSGSGRLSYIEGWKAISLANEVFGHDGWRSEVKSCEIDFCDPIGGEKFNITATAVVRITLTDGSFHEDLGLGQADNSKKGAGYEKAKKEAVTDAMKRALRMFGNVLGNCLYDKNYLSFVAKIKLGAPKFDSKGLYRRPEFSGVPLAPVFSKESSMPPSAMQTPMQTPVFAERGEFDDSFSSFGDDDDAVSVCDSVASTSFRAQSVPPRRDDRSNSMPPPPNKQNSLPNSRSTMAGHNNNQLVTPNLNPSASNTSHSNQAHTSYQNAHTNQRNYAPQPLRNITNPNQNGSITQNQINNENTKSSAEDKVFGQSIPNLSALTPELPQLHTQNIVSNAIGQSVVQTESEKRAASAARLAAMSMAMQPPETKSPPAAIEVRAPQTAAGHELKRAFSGKFEFASAKGLLQVENEETKRPRMSY